MENSISLLMGENPDWRVVRSKMNTEAEFAESLPWGCRRNCSCGVPTCGLPEQQARAAMAAAGMAIRRPLAHRVQPDGRLGKRRCERVSPAVLVCRRYARLADLRVRPNRPGTRCRAAAYDEARLGYEQKVLTVFKEANDAVVSYRSVRRRPR